ncbi:hypothetical protein PIB30_049885 [Stylosanthes scabra]|uniref:Uncharacterized protein n=1 Tax=Stylosanthes scabra TaxID=79078 RepID=A0ABU6WK76_9FABA|nr:hypothetical protein [Stylosanthes scabra]
METPNDEYFAIALRHKHYRKIGVADCRTPPSAAASPPSIVDAPLSAHPFELGSPLDCRPHLSAVAAPAPDSRGSASGSRPALPSPQPADPKLFQI